MAATAFGSHTDLFGETSDSESIVSRTSSKRKRDTYKQTFPVKGVTCVGCALANRIAPVERFVNNNVGRMSEAALWKMAALTWKLEVVQPAKREGAMVVDWAWREVANHFRLHTTNSIVGRTHMIQSLTAMRCQVEQRLVRVENGERELDKVNADLCLKVSNIQLEQMNVEHVLTAMFLCALYHRSSPPRAASAAFWRPAFLVPREEGVVGRAVSDRQVRIDQFVVRRRGRPR